MTETETTSEDMADEDKPTTDETNANAEAARYRKQRNTYRDKVADLEEQLAALTSERDQARSEFANFKAEVESKPSQEAARIAELESKIRTRDHKDAFGRLAAGKIKPEALDAAWKLGEFKADSDEINEEDMGNAIGSLIEANPFLAVESAAPSEDSGSPQATRSSGRLNSPSPVPGLGRAPANKTDSTKELLARVPNPSRLI
jgi:hypothetical protein